MSRVKYSRDLLIWLAAVSMLLVGLTCLRAAHKPFWCDEIATLGIAGQKNFADLWAAETAGFDHNPPLLYLAIRASAPAGKPELAERLPSMIGYLAMIVFLSLFVARRLPSPFSYPAVILPMLAAAYGYAYEARPYGLLLGSAGCAIFAWQAAADELTRPWNRRASLVLLTVALWIGLLSHFYAAFLYLPLGVAELWRLVQRKRGDPGMIVSLAIGALPVVLYPSLMAGTPRIATTGPMYAPTIRRLIASYWLHFSGALLPLAIALLAIGAVAFLHRDDLRSALADLLTRVPAHEVVLVSALALWPVAAFLFAIAIHGPMMPRYGLPATLGLSSLLCYLVFVLARAQPALVRGVGLVALAWFVGDFAWTARTWSDEIPYRTSPFASAVAEVMEKTDRPVVVANILSFLPFEHYLDRPMGQRLVFLYDPALALRHTAGDGGGTWPSMARPWLALPGRIMPYRDFLTGNKRFFLYDCGDRRIEWLLPELREEGALIEPWSLPGLYDITLRSEVHLSRAVSK